MLNRIFPGKLEKGAVLKAICSGFEETTEPAVCLSTGKFLPFFCFTENVLWNCFGADLILSNWYNFLGQMWRQMSV